MKKKTFLLLLAASGMIGLAGAEARFSPVPGAPRQIRIGSAPVITLAENGKAEIEVVKSRNPAVKRAETELIGRLKQITGGKIVSVGTPSGKVPVFYLGECPEAEKLGLDPKKLDMDGFYIRTDGKRIFITGCDSNAAGKRQCGTLFGVYEFLERFGGVRYYFPGEIGTIVPKKENWKLPEISIADRPDHQYRQIYTTVIKKMTTGEEFGYEGLGKNYVPSTWRNSNFYVRSCHGLNQLKLAQRFGKSHPEYFAMDKSGNRYNGNENSSGHLKDGHLCFANEAVKEIIYQDCAACLTGKPAASRGLTRWGGQFHPPFVDIMPNDGMEWCQCPVCREVMKQGKQAMSDHVWKFMIDIAKKLKKNGIGGYVTTMSYCQYSLVPDRDIPSNMLVMLAVTGPWMERIPAYRRDGDRKIAEWNRKLGGRSYIWLYPTKLGAEIPLVPNFAPRACGASFKRYADQIFGAFIEAESDRWIFGFLNCYIYSKLMWDKSTDVEALIREHCELMYGKAAPQMDKIYLELEKIWLEKILQRRKITSWGAIWELPTNRDVWTRFYSPDKISAVNKLFDEAEKAAASDPASLGRVRFMRRELWGPVLKGAAQYRRISADRSVWTLQSTPAENITLDGKLDEPAWKKAPAVWLVPRPVNLSVAEASQLKNEVRTKVKMLHDHDYFYFGFEVEEPETEIMNASVQRKNNDIDMWRDNGIEIFLAKNTESDYCQFIVTSAGRISDIRYGKNGGKGFSGFDAKVLTVRNKAWTAEIRIPRKALPELTDVKTLIGNFTRHRVLRDKKTGTEYYIWSPGERNTPEYYGTIRLEAAPRTENLIRFPDFDGPVHHKRFMGIKGWGSAAPLLLDRETFVTGGSALRLEGPSRSIRQNIAFKPNCRYKLSFFVRTEKLTAPGLKVIVRLGGEIPERTLYVMGDWKAGFSGTSPWTRLEYTFKTTPSFGRKFAPHFDFDIRNSKGICWIDHVELVELKEK